MNTWLTASKLTSLTSWPRWAKQPNARATDTDEDARTHVPLAHCPLSKLPSFQQSWNPLSSRSPKHQSLDPARDRAQEVSIVERLDQLAVRYIHHLPSSTQVPDDLPLSLDPSSAHHKTSKPFNGGRLASPSIGTSCSALVVDGAPGITLVVDSVPVSL